MYILYAFIFVGLIFPQIWKAPYPLPWVDIVFTRPIFCNIFQVANCAKIKLSCNLVVCCLSEVFASRYSGISVI
uniref:Putative secreted protein n=1 Tax=Ixodes ricinus TaxID=34613 RepID=A0A6B0TUX0_IXORI